MRKIAVIGSEEKYWTEDLKPRALKSIMEIFAKYAENMILISGGCPKGGIDIWVERIADVWKIDKEIYKPEVKQWDDEVYEIDGCGSYGHKRGYESRNIQIAEACDVLYCIDPANRTWSGGRWTLSFAKKLGKETHLVLIE